MGVRTGSPGRPSTGRTRQLRLSTGSLGAVVSTLDEVDLDALRDGRLKRR
jgi:hypothetical protein